MNTKWIIGKKYQISPTETAKLIAMDEFGDPYFEIINMDSDYESYTPSGRPEFKGLYGFPKTAPFDLIES